MALQIVSNQKDKSSINKRTYKAALHYEFFTATATLLPFRILRALYRSLCTVRQDIPALFGRVL
jgi:hypothetical protein